MTRSSGIAIVTRLCVVCVCVLYVCILCRAKLHGQIVACFCTGMNNDDDFICCLLNLLLVA